MKKIRKKNVSDMSNYDLNTTKKRVTEVTEKCL